MACPLFFLSASPHFWVRHVASLLALTGAPSLVFGQSFAPTQAYIAANTFDQVNGVVVADLNADARPDVVTACETSSNVGVLLNTGTGMFASALLNSTDMNTALGGVAVADVNADGKPDIVTGTYEKVLVLLGKGDGTFARFVPYATGSNTNIVGLAVVDVSGDGRPDIIAADNYTQVVRVLLNKGNGTFASSVAYAAGTSSYADGLAVADVNADGQLDVLTVDATHFAVQVLLGNGSGTFSPATSYPTGADSWPTSVSVGDVNADGRLDLVTANSNLFGTEGAAGVLLGNGSGTFGPVTTYPTAPTSKPTSIALADVTGDGKLDIVTANNNPSNTAYSVAVLPGTGTGAFQISRLYSPGNLGYVVGAASGVTVADMSGDGKPDIIAVNHAAGSVGILRNTSAFLATQGSVLPGQLTLWPNPAAGAASVQLALTNLPATVHHLVASLITAVGQPMSNVMVPVTQGTAHLGLTTTGLASGLYLCQLRAYDAQGEVVGTMAIQRLVLE